MYLSASKIKAFTTCSWSFFVVYHLGFRDLDPGNDGSKRGTISHLVLEMLQLEKHFEYFETARDNGPMSIPSLKRLILKHAKKLGVDDEKNLGMIDGFVQVGLKSDFFCDGWDLEPPEKHFKIENENPEYRVQGFVDKCGISKCGEACRIDDYKTSKAKFTGKDAKFNIQSLMYPLALWKEGGYKKFNVNFLFLKFPKQPWQKYEYDESDLRGFEIYLSGIYKFLKDFNIKKASSNFARDNENYFLCGKHDYQPGDLKKDGSPAWVCPWRLPFLFYQLDDSSGKRKKIAKEREKLLDFFEEGDTISERYYAGCPRFRPKIKT